LNTKAPTKIFLTGVTGFVGKVVLSELLRRRSELGVGEIFVLIRNKKGHCPQERFKNEVVASPCFAKIPPESFLEIKVIAGELSEERCGFSESDWRRLTEETTHIINCAASVEFDLPIEEAAQANITSCLHVLDFAKACKNLLSMVNVSTAYVTPHPKDGAPIGEQLARLNLDPEATYRSILAGKADTRALLRQSGLPNTYTLTKCLAEHLLVKNRAEIPLRIVRPSIVSASWRYPFPGWIDSRAAFAGFVSLIGAGYLRAVVAQYPTLLDVVPCDEVAKRVIDTAFEMRDASEVPIRYAVAGVKHSCDIRTCIEIIEGYFRRYRVGTYPNLRYVGGNTLKFKLKHWRYHLGPGKFLGTLLKIRGQTKKLKQLERLTANLDYLNRAFPYFTHNTFDFRASSPIEDPAFSKEKYIEGVCRGVYRYLMKKDDTQVTFGGRRHEEKESDLTWVRSRSQGNAAIRSSAWLARKAMRRCTDCISFDRAAFEEARRQIPTDHLLVIVPTHRSYMDFVLCSYLFFAYPEMGIAIPHIAAAEEFSKVKVLGKLFRKTQAFYVKRGLGRENPELTRQLHELVKNRETLEFFIEGTRSRSRKMLAPRRGILKCLQASGQVCSILPVSISYDRLPEEGAFERELKGEEKPPMLLSGLLRWAWQVWRGRIDLGRVHLSCGKPVTLDLTQDLTLFSRKVMRELQDGLQASTFHLKTFLARHPGSSFDLAWLQANLNARGIQVLESSLDEATQLDPSIEQSLRYQWMHAFYPEIQTLLRGHPVIQNHLVQNDYLSLEDADRGSHRQEQASASLEDPRMIELLQLLFSPMLKDYQKIADSMGSPEGSLQFASPKELIRRNPGLHLPTLEEALEDLVQREILSGPDAKGAYAWGIKAQEFSAWKSSLECLWENPGLAKVG